MIIQAKDKDNNIVIPNTDANGNFIVGAMRNGTVAGPLQSDYYGYLRVSIANIESGIPNSLYITAQNASLSAGTNVISVWAGNPYFYYRLKRINFTYIGAVTGVIIRTYLIESAVSYYFGEYRNLTSAVYINDNVDIIFNPSTTFNVQVVGATAGNGFYIFAFYEKIGGGL